MNDWLLSHASNFGVVLNDLALKRLEQYCIMLQEWNRKINLTSIVETDQIYETHFLDSLSIAKVIDLTVQRSLIDIGTGAGFPGLVLAIAYPNLHVSLLDSVEKKVRFLREVADEVGIGDRVEVCSERAEIYGAKKGKREGYDVAVSRGVARLNVLAEYCLPFVRLGGVFVAQKGPQAREELGEANSAIQKLGGGNPELIDLMLPSGASRTLVCISKQKATPMGYPRRVGLALKRPII